MKYKTKIVPAILTESQSDLVSMLSTAKTFTDWVQIDLMDGCFVPSSSISTQELAEIKPDIGWEAHLMVNNPEAVLEHIKNAGAKRVIFHYESTGDQQGVIEKARSLQLEVGIALNPDTPVEVLQNLVAKIDCVLLMTVYPGFYGAKFIPEVMDKLKLFRAKYPAIEIGIDGGVKEENLKMIVESGASSICVGSAIFLSINPAESYNRLRNIAQS
ncbi:MAG: ribulose-phosphate 3-epimerase [Dehalococcoidales bacterium]|nr:ribulose-phosphate 3-epimerase [Dehalococcoidales bacterium]